MSGDILLYHGTTSTHLDEINTDGLKDGTYFTTSYDDALFYGMMKQEIEGEGEVIVLALLLTDEDIKCEGQHDNGFFYKSIRPIDITTPEKETTER